MKRSELAKLVLIPLTISCLLGVLCLLGSSQEVKFADHYEEGGLTFSEVKGCVEDSLLAFFLLWVVELVPYSLYKAWQKLQDRT